MTTAAIEGLRDLPAAVNGLQVFLLTNTLETGGTERQFSLLARGLAGGSLRVHLGCLRNGGAFAEGLEGLEEFSPGGSLYGWKSLQARRALARHLRRNKIAVAQSFGFYSNLMLIPAARLAGVPVVIGSYRQLGDTWTKPQFWTLTAVLRLCDRVVCNSEAAAERLRDRAGLPARKLTVIPNGLAEDAFRKAVPVLPRGQGTMRVGMVARMNDRGKNHMGFLRIASKVAAKYPQVEFVLAGDGPLRGGIEEYARTLGLADRVRFLGDRRDIPEVLAALDVSVLTSVSESLSNVIMESMAAGVPVVASRVGGNSELVQDGETGFLVPAEDEDAFTAAVGRLLERDDLRGAFGAKAKTEARSRFGLTRMCSRYEELYRSIVSEKGAAAAA